jgi:hypothetical protein
MRKILFSFLSVYGTFAFIKLRQHGPCSADIRSPLLDELPLLFNVELIDLKKPQHANFAVALIPLPFGNEKHGTPFAIESDVTTYKTVATCCLKSGAV